MAVVRQHYIPQFILREWANEQGNLCRYQPSPYPSARYRFYPPKSVCQKPYGYEIDPRKGTILTNWVEQAFGREKTRLAPFYRRLVHQILPSVKAFSQLVLVTAEEREGLRQLAALLILRSPSFQRWLGQVEAEDLSELSTMLYTLFDTMKAPADKTRLLRCVMMVDRPDLPDGCLGGSALRAARQVFEKARKFFFVKSPEGRFCFGDDYPVALRDPDTGTPSEIFLPLSPSYGVWFYDPKRHERDGIKPNRLHALPPDVEQLTMKQVFLYNLAARQSLYARSKECLSDWDARLSFSRLTGTTPEKAGSGKMEERPERRIQL